MYFLLICGGLFAQGFVQATLTNANQSLALCCRTRFLKSGLPSTPSNGFGWYLKENSNSRLVQQVEQAGFESDNSQNLEGISGDQIIRYIPTAAGTCNLELEYRRPWENADQIQSTYKLRVNCEGAYSGNYVPVQLENTIIEPSNTSERLLQLYTALHRNQPLQKSGSCRKLLVICVKWCV